MRIAILTAVLLASLGVAAAQEPRQTNQAWIDRTNQGTVGVVTGGVDGTYIRFGADLNNVLDDGDSLRVLTILGRGSVQNLGDLLFLRGVDVVFVQSDILAYSRQRKLYPGLDQGVQYITSLYREEVHVLARADIRDLTELQGKPVNVDLVGSGTAMTASVLFGSLGISPDFRNTDQTAALNKLLRGELAAMVYVVGQPARLFANVPANTGLHFLTIMPQKNLPEVYEPAVITSDRYPTLMETAIPTVGVRAVLAVYGWPNGSDRYKKVARFVTAFLAHFDELQRPPRHPKWLEVDITAELPGWKRFPVVADFLQRHPMTGDLNRFLATLPIDPGAKQDLMARYQEWKAQNETTPGVVQPPVATAPPPPEQPRTVVVRGKQPRAAVKEVPDNPQPDDLLREIDRVKQAARRP
jgi:uncharacterized protein